MSADPEEYDLVSNEGPWDASSLALEGVGWGHLQEL